MNSAKYSGTSQKDSMNTTDQPIPNIPTKIHTSEIRQHGGHWTIAWDASTSPSSHYEYRTEIRYERKSLVLKGDPYRSCAPKNPNDRLIVSAEYGVNIWCAVDEIWECYTELNQPMLRGATLYP
jgi:hypothetical protein